ncbi:hypothetical protein BAE44_0014079, partial [Dichanthelium oligosanthes]
LETDCKCIIELFSKPESQRSRLNFIIKDTIEAGRSLPEFVFKHTKREQNCVAHELAQLAKRTRHAAVWHLRFPVCEEQIIAQECNFSSK